MLSAQLPYLDIRESMLREMMLHFLENIIRRLIWHQPEVDLRRGAVRKDRFRSGPRVPRLDPTNRAGGLVEVPFDQLQAGHAEQELIDAEIAAPQIIVTGRRQPAQMFHLLG